MSVELATPVGRCLYRYFPHGRIIVQKLLAFLISQIWEYTIFKSRDLAYWKPSTFNNTSFIFGIGYGFRFNCLFIFLRSLRKRTWFDLGLRWEQNWTPHYESFSTLRTHNMTKYSTFFLKTSPCTFSNGYFYKHTGFVPSFISKSTGSVFQVPSVP